MTDTEYIQITHRELPYTTFDADNHLYENRDALTKFLPKEYEGVIKYVEIDGRTKLAIRDKISDYIPNPTFAKVAVPGGAGYDVTKGGEGFGDRRRPGFGKMVAMPGLDAFFDPEPRLELMKEMGIDRTLLWPTLASALEERMADDPDGVCAVIHALNEWMHEHWSYVYSDAIYSTPIISLAARRRRRARGARVHPRARRQDLPDPRRRRCPRGRAASRSRSPSSTRSGSGCRSSTSPSACTPATPATPATPTSGRASATAR